MNVTERLAKFIVDVTYDHLPEKVIEQGKKCFLDWLGVALAGSTYPIADIMAELNGDLGGKKQATFLGRGIKGNLLNTSLANGTISHVLDFDDTHTGSFCHVSCAIMPVIFTLGEYLHTSGKDCLAAFVAAFETSSRVGMAIAPGHYNAGWHTTSTLGRLGAAVASGKLLGLDEQQTRRALGIGATQAGGFQVVFGTMCKPLHAGKAAMDGLLSAMLAKKGFDSPENILDVPKGFCGMFSEKSAFDKALSGLGESYEIMNNSFKPYASCLFTHSPIDAALDLRDSHSISPDEIEKVHCRVAPLATEVAGRLEPKTALEGKFSIYYAVAVALAEGEVGEDKFTDERMRDANLFAFQKKVSLEEDADFDNITAELTIKMQDGSEYTKKVLSPKGGPENPLSSPELERKFRALAGMVLSERKVEKLATNILRLEKLTDINTFVSLCY